jgi:phosphoketolase
MNDNPLLKEPLQPRHITSLDAHRGYIREHGEDLPDIRDRRWGRQ